MLRTNAVADESAILRWNKERFVLDEVAPGFTPQEVIELTEMEFTPAPGVKHNGVIRPGISRLPRSSNRK